MFLQVWAKTVIFAFSASLTVASNKTKEEKLLLLSEKVTNVPKTWIAYSHLSLGVSISNIGTTNLRKIWKEIFQKIDSLVHVSVGCNSKLHKDPHIREQHRWHICAFRGIHDCAKNGGKPGTQCLSKLSSLNLARNETISSLVMKNTRPAGKECVCVVYGNKSQTDVNLQKHRWFDFSVLDRIEFRFSAHIRLGQNITFREFLLSDMCYLEHPFLESRCHLHWGTEYLLVHQNGHIPLYYCLKRAQWSVYTMSQAHIEYSLCKFCVQIKSTMVVDYQVIDSETFVTKRDNFRFVINWVKAPYIESLICVAPCTESSLRIWTVYIRVQKHREITFFSNVFLMDKGHFLIFPQQFLLVAGEKTYIAENNTMFMHQCKSFYCCVKILVDTVELFQHQPLNKPRTKGLRFSYSTSKIQNVETFNAQPDIQHFYANCSDQKVCHKALKISSANPDFFIQVNITNMIYTGWKVPTCFFGGIAVHDTHSYGTFEETLSVCDNYTLMNCSECTDKKLLPYNSVTKSIIVVFYNLLQSSLLVCLSISQTACEGVFIEPCSNSIFPYSSNTMTIDYIFHVHQCSVYQIGLLYLESDQVSKLFGCIETIKLHRTFAVREREIVLDYFHVLEEFHYTSEAIAGDVPGDLLFFGHVVRNSSPSLKPSAQLPCDPNMPRGNLVFETNTNVSLVRNASRVSSLHVTIDIDYAYSRLESYNPIQDSFLLKVGPFSDSARSLKIYHNLERNTSFTGTKGLPLHSLYKSTNCPLTKVNEGPANNLALKLTFNGQFAEKKCHIGFIKTYSWICLSENKYKEKNRILYYGLFFAEKVPKCPQKSKNFGEDVFVQTLQITTDTVYFSNNVLSMQVFGKVVGARFFANSTNCCESKCYLQAKWSPTCLVPHPVLKSYEVLSKSGEDVFAKPADRTWHEAEHMCRKRGQILPIFTFEEDLQDIVLYIICYTNVFQTSSIFVGMTKQVSFQHLA